MSKDKTLRNPQAAPWAGVSKRASDEDFNAAANWFFNLPREKMIAICKEVNPETPHSLEDKHLVPMWMKFKHT